MMRHVLSYIDFNIQATNYIREILKIAPEHTGLKTLPHRGCYLKFILYPYNL